MLAVTPSLHLFRHVFLIFATTFFVALHVPLSAKIMGYEFTYQEGNTPLKGYFSYDDSIEGKRPGVLVIHEWWGHNAMVRIRADMLARLGYTALAIDMYGDGKTADHPDNAKAFATAVFSDTAVAEARFLAALNVLKSHPKVDGGKTAAIGYCFGGGIALNMAFSGIDLNGVASFHGSLPEQAWKPELPVKAAILVCNGADDPMVTAEQIEAFKALAASKQVDLTFRNYPDAKHSFTHPSADALGEKFELPLAYSATADKQSWLDLQEFLVRIFK